MIVLIGGASKERGCAGEEGISTNVPPSAHRSLIMLPISVDGSFDLEASFTRHAGNDFVAVLLPVRPHGCSIIISGWNGRSSWIDGIKGLAPEDMLEVPVCQFRREDGSLTNGRRYSVLTQVRQEGKQVSIEVFLDGQPYLSWSGDGDSIRLWGYLSTGDSSRLGFAAIDCSVTFHTARFRLHSGRALLIGNRESETATVLGPDAEGSHP